MKRKKSNFTWQLFLIGIPFAAFGLIALGLAIWQLTSHVRALGWVEHPAVLLSLETAMAPGRHLRTQPTSRLEG
ncbi:MAG TPA: hypothetical protein PLW86_10530, partial [Rhodocyclaceae bacterium]|nr:hypothetical protein [Rhodocyclaceae bacterium]